MGGGSPSIPQRNLTNELGQVFTQSFPQENKAYQGWWQGEPLLSASHNLALSDIANLPQLTDPLMKSFQTLPGQIGGYVGDTKALAGPLQNMLDSLGGVYSKQIAPILNTGGALTPEQNATLTSQTNADYAARGNVMGNQALFANALNRDQYRQNRFASALGQGLGISGQESALTSGLQSLIGQEAGLTGQQAGLQTGLAQGIQGLQSGAINPALQTEQSQVGTFATLMNPLLSYASNLNEGNQNAAAAQSIAGANKSSGLMGGGLSALGSIAGGVGMAL